MRSASRVEPRVWLVAKQGHVSLLTGFSKDISAVPKGWTANLVEFDSVINQSRVTVAPYSPDRCANWVL